MMDGDSDAIKAAKVKLYGLTGDLPHSMDEWVDELVEVIRIAVREEEEKRGREAT